MHYRPGSNIAGGIVSRADHGSAAGELPQFCKLACDRSAAVVLSRACSTAWIRPECVGSGWETKLPELERDVV